MDFWFSSNQGVIDDKTLDVFFILVYHEMKFDLTVHIIRLRQKAETAAEVASWSTARAQTMSPR